VKLRVLSGVLSGIADLAATEATSRCGCTQHRRRFLRRSHGIPDLCRPAEQSDGVRSPGATGAMID
jgi:hypothetical protein